MRRDEWIWEEETSAPAPVPSFEGPVEGFNGKVKHYQVAGVEANDVIKDVLAAWSEYLYENEYGAEEVAVLAWYMGNVLKYTLRAPKKNQFRDLGKLKDYLNQFIEYANRS